MATSIIEVKPNGPRRSISELTGTPNSRVWECTVAITRWACRPLIDWVPPSTRHGVSWLKRPTAKLWVRSEPWEGETPVAQSPLLLLMDARATQDLGVVLRPEVLVGARQGLGITCDDEMLDLVFELTIEPRYNLI